MGRHETGLMDVVKFSRCTGSDSRGSLGPRDSISRSCIGIGIAVNYARRISFTFFSTNFCQISKYPRDLYRRVISKGRKGFLFFFFSLGFEKIFPSGKNTFTYFCEKIQQSDRLKFVYIFVDLSIIRLNFSQNSFASDESILLTFQENSSDSFQF